MKAFKATSPAGLVIGYVADTPNPEHFQEGWRLECVEDAYGVMTEEAPIVPTGVTLTKLEYLRRFTQAERITIRTVAETNPILADYMELLNIATEVNTNDPDTVAAVHMLEAVGLIATGRAKEILYGE